MASHLSKILRELLATTLTVRQSKNQLFSTEDCAG